MVHCINRGLTYKFLDQIFSEGRFVLVNSVDADTPHLARFHLGLHCLQNTFRII